jgi:hypothetical protein
VPGMGRAAVLRDPQGAVFGVFASGGGRQTRLRLLGARVPRPRAPPPAVDRRQLAAVTPRAFRT